MEKCLGHESNFLQPSFTDSSEFRSALLNRIGIDHRTNSTQHIELQSVHAIKIYVDA
jgi:hypothetical protein